MQIINQWILIFGLYNFVCVCGGGGGGLWGRASLMPMDGKGERGDYFRRTKSQILRGTGAAYKDNIGEQGKQEIRFSSMGKQANFFQVPPLLPLEGLITRL